MIGTFIHLECDSCGDPFPSCGVYPSPEDGAIVTAAQLRRNARAAGWVRKFLETRMQRDLCPRCAKKAARK